MAASQPIYAGRGDGRAESTDNRGGNHTSDYTQSRLIMTARNHTRNYTSLTDAADTIPRRQFPPLLQTRQKPKNEPLLPPTESPVTLLLDPHRRLKCGLI
ncbi:protein of unknown function (plasmid) [Pseudorhizobium banfieldiae]|uniref:Uncharacterized protein n=1 Tax=Pseudorhizobium banfieldiae TaxID=1125847 RepID=L0NN64_9HYPH|nr:protein of unknown function [Pseudorhizobium banfieldiae]